MNVLIVRPTRRCEMVTLLSREQDILKITVLLLNTIFLTSTEREEQTWNDERHPLVVLFALVTNPL